MFSRVPSQSLVVQQGFWAIPPQAIFSIFVRVDCVPDQCVPELSFWPGVKI